MINRNAVFPELLIICGISTSHGTFQQAIHTLIMYYMYYSIQIGKRLSLVSFVDYPVLQIAANWQPYWRGVISV